MLRFLKTSWPIGIEDLSRLRLARPKVRDHAFSTSSLACQDTIKIRPTLRSFTTGKVDARPVPGPSH